MDIEKEIMKIEVKEAVKQLDQCQRLQLLEFIKELKERGGQNGKVQETS